MPAFDLVIFDLDGTLVPTEEIALKMTAELLAEHLGITMSNAELRERYHGRDVPYRIADFERLYGKPLPDTFLTAMLDRWIHALENDLVPTDGVIDAIEALGDVPMCVASNGDLPSIELSLRSTGLDKYLPRFFSHTQVLQPKPAPDLFLFAANEMGAEPSRCLVVEDSALGITGAKAAGMTVVGFAGNDLASLAGLKVLDVPVIEDFADLPAIVLQR